ncbi:hypothetical protein LOK49_LG08G01634 [Camellia lanceoleosa]|uniref:Uncharacterized protein n=1 Tax=Camellia lanceoleosa TaxID=1840588 RepID=A0ACC0GS42_9ERIC|nr:hypothetical protein LOK49_LG08G01634 [Camellia lanceoleosa]
MDGQQSTAKLKRTQSSLLRSSPTIRSSIQTLSSVNEIRQDEEDEEEQKPHKPGSSPVRRHSRRFAPFLALLSLSLHPLPLFRQRRHTHLGKPPLSTDFRRHRSLLRWQKQGSDSSKLFVSLQATWVLAEQPQTGPMVHRRVDFIEKRPKIEANCKRRS